MGGRILLLLGVLLAWSGCTTNQPPEARACSVDADCAAGTVCRVARCRKACAGGRWVGEAVHVKCEQGARTAAISGCDGVPPVAPGASAAASSEPPKSVPPTKPAQLWVRYESGIEEQVSLDRIKPVHGAQASAR